MKKLKILNKILKAIFIVAGILMISCVISLIIEFLLSIPYVNIIFVVTVLVALFAIVLYAMYEGE